MADRLSRPSQLLTPFLHSCTCESLSCEQMLSSPRPLYHIFMCPLLFVCVICLVSFLSELYSIAWRADRSFPDVYCIQYCILYICYSLLCFHLDSAFIYVTNVYGRTVILVVNFHVRVAFELHSHIPGPSGHMLSDPNMVYNIGTL